MRVQRRYGNPSQHRRTATQSPIGQLGWVVCAISPLSATSSTGTRRGKRAGRRTAPQDSPGGGYLMHARSEHALNSLGRSKKDNPTELTKLVQVAY